MFADRARRQRGSIIFPLIIAVAVAVASLSIYYSQMALVHKIGNNRLMIGTALKAHVSSVQAMIISQKSMMKTLKSGLNGNLWRCLNDVEYTCTQSTPSPLSLISETGDDTNPFVDQTAGTGLSANLDPCTGYPSLNCPFRYEMTWHAECSDGTGSCKAPDLFFEGNLLVADNVKGVISLNTKTYYLLYRVR
ncbi:MAG TPA: hypothetical protein VN132_03335 [Bdellovibrio sp.]|nr:hypothetical protein [Bdellovibrio sp.]